MEKLPLIRGFQYKNWNKQWNGKGHNVGRQANESFLINLNINHMIIIPELINEMVHVDEQQVEVLQFLSPFGRLGGSDQDIQQVKKIHL